LALPASVVSTPGRMSKKCCTPHRQPPAIYTVSMIIQKFSYFISA
jgi:hypothetical protein